MSLVKKSYTSVYKASPTAVKSVLSQLAFKVLDKPSVLLNGKKPYWPNGASAGFVISADFELAWGWRYTTKFKDPLKAALNKARQARDNFNTILNQLDRFNIPITWATVGHLFLNRCNKADHEWMSPVKSFNDHWSFTGDNWYEHDPYSNYLDAPEWYAPDLIEKILSAKANHEIGSHSFSHMHFGSAFSSSQVAEDEIIASIKASKQWGLDLRSMVFPGGKNGHYSLLKKYGFTNYRENSYYDLFYPHVDGYGLVKLPSSFSIEDGGLKWSKEYIIHRFQKYVQKAINTNTCCMAWFHPSENHWIFKDLLPKLLYHVAELRDKGVLYIGTMQDMSVVSRTSL